MIVLAIDTATEVLSVALVRTGGEQPPWTHSVVADDGLHHTALLMESVDLLLRRAGMRAGDVDLFACMRGPGSFTGLRIGMATAKGLAEAAAATRGLSVAPLVSLPTLTVMARSVASPLVIAVIDGRKKRYYSALAKSGSVTVGPVDLPAADTIPTLIGQDPSLDGQHGPFVVTGPHAPQFAAAVTSTVRSGEHAELVVDPRHRCGWATQLAHYAPAYFEKFGPDPRDQGPEYVRMSDAEIGVRR